MNWSVFLNPFRLNIPLTLMVLAVFVSAISVIYTKHISRAEFVALQRLENQRDDLNEEWGRLLLEQSTWGAPGRVEQQARSRLDMLVPGRDVTVMLIP